MSSSNNRVHEYDSVHHITSRIAHRVFFLGESERNDIIEFIRRSSEFAGLKLLGWCILSNHFHLLVYLPHPEIVDEEEVLRRYGILKGEKARRAAEIQLAQWRKGGDDLCAGEWLDGIRKRMGYRPEGWLSLETFKSETEAIYIRGSNCLKGNLEGLWMEDIILVGKCHEGRRDALHGGVSRSAASTVRLADDSYPVVLVRRTSENEKRIVS